MIVDVEATETTVPALLENIERGDEVRLRRNGKTVATIRPATSESRPLRTAEQIASGQAAMDRMDARAKRLELKFDFDEFKADKEFGRR